MPANPTFVNDAHRGLRLWPVTSKIKRDHPLAMVVCQVWWKSTQRFSLYRFHKLISIYVNCDLNLWPLTSKINMVHSLTMANMSGKFDEEAHNGLRPVHTRDPINPRSLPLRKNGQVGNERALIGESVRWSKIQRGLVGPALRGRGERDKFFNRLKNGRGWSRSPQVVCWAGVQRGGRRYSVSWSYFDRVKSAIQRK